MSVETKQPDPPVLSPAQSEAVPTWRAAYSDRTSALMAAFCQIARVPLAAVSPAPPPGSPKTERGGGRKKLEALLSAGGFRLVEVFNKDEAQAFLAVRDDRFAVLAFRGTETLQDRHTDFNVKRVPLPGVPGVTVHCGFLEVFECCRKEIEVADALYRPPVLALRRSALWRVVPDHWVSGKVLETIKDNPVKNQKTARVGFPTHNRHAIRNA